MYDGPEALAVLGKICRAGLLLFSQNEGLKASEISCLASSQTEQDASAEEGVHHSGFGKEREGEEA